MNISRPIRLGLSFAAASVLAACGGTGLQTPLSATTGAQDSARSYHVRSWMNPDAKKYNLLYLSSRGTEDVYVYTYPGGTLEGTLTGFATPQGECVDKVGDVFITDTSVAKIYEYAHGGPSPKATLSDPGGYPQGCSVNPETGDLAVADIGGNPSSSQGNVGIYINASGTPTYYTDSSLYRPYFCGYDMKGDLFVDGLERPSGGFQLAELPNGGSSLTNITLNQTVSWPGGVQWSGKYLAVGQEGDGYQGSTVVYEFSIKHSNGTLHNTTSFPDAYSIYQFWIDGATIIAPDYDGMYVGFFDYPAGGSPYKSISLSYPFGAVVSKK